MVLSKKRLSLQGGDLPSETDLPQETHVSFIATVRNSDVHSTIQRIYCGLILVTLCWQGHKSKKEVMMEIISKSKFYKVEYTCHLVILSLNILIYLGSVSPYVIDAFLVWYCYLEHLSLSITYGSILCLPFWLQLTSLLSLWSVKIETTGYLVCTYCIMIDGLIECVLTIGTFSFHIPFSEVYANFSDFFP